MARVRPDGEIGDRVPAGRVLTIHLVKLHRPAITYTGRVVADDGIHLVIEAPWIFSAVDLGFVRFEPGDVFFEHYWRDRWYSVKDIRGGGGARKGWYCDATRLPVLDGDELTSSDVELDLWVAADRRTILRLDEEEFAASGLAEEDPNATAAAAAAIDELERLARAGSFPFV